MKKKKNLLEQKEAELAALNERSGYAIQLVNATIEGLERTNAQIQEKINEIDAAQRSLSDTRDGFESTYMKNQKIAQNFKTLLCIE